MNINDKSAKRTCTSCQMCAAVCPKNAIKVVLDDNGFYRPTIDDVRCVDCSICTKVCYKFDTQIEAFERISLQVLNFMELMPRIGILWQIPLPVVWQMF